MAGLPRSTSYRKVIKRFKELGWSGPNQGRGPHPHMTKGAQTQTVPNNHGGDIDVSLLAEILRQAGISKDEWLGVKQEAEEAKTEVPKDDPSDSCDDDDHGKPGHQCRPHDATEP